MWEVLLFTYGVVYFWGIETEWVFIKNKIIMKRMLMLFTIMLVGMFVYSQSEVKEMWEYDHKSQRFGRVLPTGSYIMLTDSSSIYRVDDAVAALETISLAFTNSKLTRYGGFPGSGSDSSFLATTGDYGYGTYQFNSSSFYIKGQAGLGSNNSPLVVSTPAGTPQLLLYDFDAGDAAEPFWYFQSANDGSNGVLYIGHADLSAGLTTASNADVFILTPTALTLGSAEAVGSIDLYADLITMADSTGIRLPDKDGNIYRMFVTSSGTVSCTIVP